MTEETLNDLLPEGNENAPLDGLPEFEDVAPSQTVEKPLTEADKANIEAHIDNLIEGVAVIGSETMPPALRDEYVDSFTSSKLVRAGVVATGIGPALHELMPSDGTQAAGPVRQLHPLVRVALGLAVLGLATVVQKKAVLNAHQTANSDSSGGGSPSAGGSVLNFQALQGFGKTFRK